LRRLRRWRRLQRLWRRRRRLWRRLRKRLQRLRLRRWRRLQRLWLLRRRRPWLRRRWRRQLVRLWLRQLLLLLLRQRRRWCFLGHCFSDIEPKRVLENALNTAFCTSATGAKRRVEHKSSSRAQDAEKFPVANLLVFYVRSAPLQLNVIERSVRKEPE
jgi:hypothetical protein